MNTAQNVYIHKTAFSGLPSQVLREGCSVFVRIISQTGPESYVASFSGARFSVSSDTILTPGETFTATISLSDGKIVLVPRQKDGMIFAETPVVQKFPADIRADGQLADQKLSSFFMSLGLVPDTITLTLFTEMKELGMRFDAAVLNKARRAGEKFPGREKDAAEIALILEQKGIPSEENAIEALLGGTEEDSAGDNRKDTESQNSRMKPDIKSDENELKQNAEAIVEEVSRFFTGVFSGKIPAEPVSEGILTIFNHSGFSEGTDSFGSWIQVPFVLSLDNGRHQGKGVLRCFLGGDYQKNKKFIVKIEFNMKSYFFVLYYLNSEYRKICFSVIPSISIAEFEKQKSQLEKLFQNILHYKGKIEIEWADPNTLSGFCTDMQPVSVVRGNV
jgi:hypothetical protein